MIENTLVDAALENTEALVDAMTDNEILKSIPVVGTVLKVIKGAGDIRDRLFAAKLLRFLKSIETVSQDLKENIRKRVAESPEGACKVGETVVLLLDRLADLDKTDIIAKVFIAYAFGHVKDIDFQRIVQAVDQAVLYDLQKLLASHNIGKQEPSTAYFMQALYPSGLTQIVSGETVATIGEHYFVVSQLGNKLINAYNQGMKLSKKGE